MKTTRNLLTLAIAAVSPAVAFLALANVITAEVALATISVAGLAAFAAFDYSRSVKSLRAPGRLLRPALPASTRVAPAIVARRAA